MESEGMYGTRKAPGFVALIDVVRTSRKQASFLLGQSQLHLLTSGTREWRQFQMTVHVCEL
jgi:hypothetical protein